MKRQVTIYTAHKKPIQFVLEQNAAQWLEQRWVDAVESKESEQILEINMGDDDTWKFNAGHIIAISNVADTVRR